jgi:hypothetical protein
MVSEGVVKNLQSGPPATYTFRFDIVKPKVFVITEKSAGSAICGLLRREGSTIYTTLS